MTCPACIEKRRHTAEELAAHHPDAKQGYTKEHGWTKPGMEPKK